MQSSTPPSQNRRRQTPNVKSTMELSLFSRPGVLVCLLLAAWWTPHNDAVNVGNLMMMKRRGETATTTKPSETAGETTLCDEQLIKSLSIANEAKATALREKEEAREAHAATMVEVEKLKEELRTTTDSLETQVEHLQSKLIAAEKDHHSKIEAINQDMAQQIQTIQSESQMLVQKAESQRDERVAGVQQSMEELRAEKDRRIAATEQDTASKIAGMAAEHKRALQKAQTEHAETVAALKLEIQVVEEKAESNVNTMTKKFAAREEEITSKAQETLANWTLEHNRKVADLEATVRRLEKTTESWKERYETLEAMYNAASKELAELQALQSARSYCNFTYMQEDALATAAVAQQKVKENLVVAADQATKVARQISDKAATVAAPHLHRSRELYDVNVKPHVDQHVSPVYNKHVSPLLRQIGVHLQDASVALSYQVNAAHNGLVERYSVHCPQARERLENMEAPSFLVEHVANACDDPEGAVNRYLYIALFVLMFVFRSFLWRTLMAVVMFPFRAVWFFSPLRLLFKGEEKQMDYDDDYSMYVLFQKCGRLGEC
jgi:hypothetical protein